MPRIRTLKPDFFRSPDTARCSFPVRIFYEALWCWADDFGIGETNINGLLGFAFPDEDGFTAQDVRTFCADCAQHYGVIFYTVGGRHYYAIPSWEKHQKLEKRTERRKFPLPDDPDATPDLRFYPGAQSALNSLRESGAESAPIRAGTGEQGNRGTGEAAANAAARPPRTRTFTEMTGGTDKPPPPDPGPHSLTARTLIKRVVADAYPADIRGKLSHFAARLIEDGTEAELVEAGLQLWLTKAHLGPAALSSCVAEVIKTRTNGHAPMGRASSKAQGILDAGARLAERMRAAETDQPGIEAP